MPRRSAAALSVVQAVSFDGRPAPPDDLTKAQKEFWRRVVANEAAGYFNTAALQAVLKEFCRHADACDVLAKPIDGFDPELLETEEGTLRYEMLLRMRDKESKALGDKATKLRITNQSRYTPAAAASASKNQRPMKLWERQG